MLFNKNKIVIGKISRVDLDSGIYVELLNDVEGFVPLDHIGNIPTSTIKQYFAKYEHYKFKIIEDRTKTDGLIYLSYKLCHPYLIKNKHKILPTSNNFKNLRNALVVDIIDYKKQQRH